MKSAFTSLIIFVFFFGACAHVKPLPTPEKATVVDAAWPDITYALWTPCEREQIFTNGQKPHSKEQEVRLCAMPLFHNTVIIAMNTTALTAQ